MFDLLPAVAGGRARATSTPYHMGPKPPTPRPSPPYLSCSTVPSLECGQMKYSKRHDAFICSDCHSCVVRKMTTAPN
jgi:hypothetical protein